MTRRTKIRSTSVTILATVLGAFMGAGSVPAQQPVVAAGLCTRLALPPDSWIHRPVWVESRSQILAPPPVHGTRKLTTLLASGASAGPLYSDLDAYAFSQIDNEFLQFSPIRDTHGVQTGVQVTWLDRDLEPKGRIPLIDPSQGPDSIRILSLLDWVVAGNDLVGFGGYSAGPGHRDMGFFQHRLHRPESGLRGEGRLLFSFKSPKYYAGYERYFTALGSTAYFLQMEEGERPMLFRLSPEQGTPARLLTGFPGEDQSLPSLGDVTSYKEVQEIRHPRLDRASLTRGLYSQGELLYALHRSHKNGWRLIQMQPNEDDVTVLGIMRIPSSAQILTLLPTQDAWFVFEHEFREDGMTRVPTMLVLPQKVVKNSFDSALYGPGADWIRCADQ